ncbi:glycoside hydrolase family 2 protein [Paramicrobacterium chengjingii]|uniref:glycoside hydrolase family 2 protein n=1 Tax=Paramicrobacterium chengjingii TaxID=2769067 RepID=UPI001AB0248B|nr:glycoside hydrolase family 2 protein [Microbacterium chengjingii]
MTLRTLNTASDVTAQRNSLAAQWTLRATGGPIDSAVADRDVPASVPGAVQLDLVAAGLIGDPYDGANEKAQEWIGYCDWQYVARFTWDRTDDTRHDLVADGLDTAATITLNGTRVANTQNQHRSYRFDIASLLIDGENEIVIDFRSPIEFAREQERLLGARPTVMHHPFNAVRTMACTFGWDWGIDVSTCGIWKSIGIESWSGVRIAGVRPLVSVTDIDGTRGTGTLDAHVDLEWADAASSTNVVVTVAGATASSVLAPGQTRAHVTVDAGTVDLWFPRTHGAQPRYDVTVTAGEAHWSAPVGFRRVETDTAPDAHGSPFTISVNEQPVYVRGANWIPADTFVARVTPQMYQTGVRDAVDADMNLLRVWGGGIYEQDAFYEACSAAGILVWQDFPFACAAYSEEDPLRGEVEMEARENVARISHHASIALWNGCNENIWGWLEWGWRTELGDRTWGEGYYTDLLPSIVAELDPTTPYSPGSPFSFTHWAHPNDERFGTTHIWTVWNQLDYTAYRDYRPRFASEFGYQGPPAWSTLTGAVHDRPLDPNGPQMLVHQKADQGNVKLERGLGDHLPKWRDIDEWHWTTQLNQAHAIRYGIEHFRSLYPLNTGSIVWQLNDTWPVISWAAVDHAGIRKPVWHALAAVYADRLLTVQPREGAQSHQSRPALVAHNDSAEHWSARVTIARRRFDGETLATQLLDLDVELRGATQLDLADDVIAVTDADGEYLAIESTSGETAFWYFAPDRDLSLSRNALTITSERREHAVHVTVTASSLVKDVVLQADRLDPTARVDSGLVTLQAGQSHTFVVTGEEAVSTGAYCGFPVICSVNDLVAR